MAWWLVAALAAALPGLGCGQSVVGMPCSASDPCPNNFDCGIDGDRELVCARVCDLSTETVCDDGGTCLPVGSMGSICYAGGAVGIGGTCEGDLDCTHGAICLGVVGTTRPPRCFRGCNYGEPNTCPGSSHCSPSTNGGGYCP
jgi:hypothetical protein